jgi:hypothetical protein
MIRIDSLEKVKNLRKEDVIFSDDEILYRVTNISDASVTLFKINSLDAHLKIVTLHDLLWESWHLL